MLEVDTPSGTARAHLRPAAGAFGTLVLGHGAGGGIASRDLVAAADAAASLGLGVALVEQPYRAAGRKSAPPAPRLDDAWIAVIQALRDEGFAARTLIAGGRSSGARVACRTAEATGAAGVLCLAFPLVPPPRAGGKPAPSRLPELDAVSVPTLVVQGVNDRFGMPPPGPTRTVVQVRGDHGLRTDLAAVGDAVRSWLPNVLG
ncbi:MAG TPA: alpha/beta family hydrolase [Gaiellaceae bacterium]|nr:alpha/beta family hydrolase [Gaiellaceae bacterium]